MPRESLRSVVGVRLKSWFASCAIHQPLPTQPPMARRSKGIVLGRIAVPRGTPPSIRGRTYSIEAFANSQQCTPVQFRVEAGQMVGPLQGTYVSPDVRYLCVQIPRQDGVTNRYFKAVVQ
jgi:hypothetical protein